MKFLAQVPTNGAAIGRHGTVAQTEAVKDLAVGCCHDLVAGLGGVLVAVKAIGILHGEFAPAHEAKARAAFVAKFGLNLVQILRQLLVALDLLACDVGDHFLAGRLHHVIACMAVLDAQQFRAHLGETSGFLPEFGRLHDGHGQLDGAGPVHLFAHDLLHLAYDTQAHGHVGVYPRPQFFNQTGAHH